MPENDPNKAAANEEAAQALQDHINNQDEAKVPPPEDENGEQKDVDPVEYVALTVAGLESSVKSLHMAIQGMSARMDAMENYISYLLSKDKEFMEAQEKRQKEIEAAQRGEAPDAENPENGEPETENNQTAEPETENTQEADKMDKEAEGEEATKTE